MTIELVSADNITSVCSVCGEVLGYKPAGRQIEARFMASHSYCPSHLAQAMSALHTQVPGRQSALPGDGSR